jgi:hypothetical protein
MNLSQQITRKERHRQTVRRKIVALDERRRELVALERSAAAEVARLRQVEREERRANAERSGLDPHRQAGRYVDVALGVFRDVGAVISQREVGVRGAIPNGTLTHAMKALAADGLIEKVGRKDNRSEEWRLTAKGRVTETVRRPGS